jgi:hypothetical protein
MPTTFHRLYHLKQPGTPIAQNLYGERGFFLVGIEQLPEDCSIPTVNLSMGFLQRLLHCLRRKEVVVKKSILFAIVLAVVWWTGGNALASLNDGLVVHYEFESNARDSSGNNYHGAEYGGLRYLNGVIGQAASFDGIDDYVDMGVALGNYSAVSVFAWVKIFNQAGNGNRWLMSTNWDRGDCCGNSEGGFQFAITDGYPSSWIIDSGTVASVVAYPPGIKKQEWHLLGFTWDGFVHKMYCNGVEVSSDPYTGLMGISSKNSLVGAYWDAPGTAVTDLFTGEIDDLRIYDRALSATEIQKLYHYLELAADFGPSGLYIYDGTSKDRISTADPDGLAAYRDKLVANFPGFGLYEYDGSWSKIATNDTQEDMIAVGSSLYVDFGSSGLYRYDGSGWLRLTSADPDGLAGYGGKLVVKFSGLGLYEFAGRWERITTDDGAESMVGVNSTLYVDFGTQGLYQYDGSSWQSINTADPTGLATYANKLVANFPSLGLYEYDGSWNRISNNDTAEGMCGVARILYVDFAAAGLYRYDGENFKRVSTSDCEGMAVADLP